MKKRFHMTEKNLLLCTTLCLFGFSANEAVSATTTASTTRAGKTVKVAKSIAASRRPAVHDLVNHKGEEISVTAGRRVGRSVLSSSTPAHSTTQVTVVSGSQLAATGQSNLMQALSQLSPSITSPPMPGGGNNGFTQTMQLRGLSADQTLILVNGHRRHIGANFNALVGPQWGSEPADIALIPISAVDHVEVITEGATALYGQDAMAGAVNIVLKSATHGGSINFKNSGFYAGDGQNIDGSANLAFALGKRGGYLDLAAQVMHQLPASRNGDYINPSRYPNDFYYALPNGSVDPRSNRSRDVQRSNSLSKRTMETLSANMSVPLTEHIDLYSTSTYAHRKVSVGQTYRSAADDLTVTALWPDGMQPYYDMTENDFEVDNGFKGHTFGFSWDTYVNYAKDLQNYDMRDTDNASYGNESKTKFDTGSATASQLTAGFRASRNFNVGFLPKPVNLEFGAEYRRDTFTLGAGEYASYASGGVPILTGPDAGMVATPGAATHAGNPASVAGKYTRDVYDGHVNLDFFVTRKWEWTLGGRTVAYHNYPVVATGSIGTRYNFNKKWAIRANINTGYRPPTLGQTYYYYSSPSATYSTLSLPNNSPAARALGAGPLKGEYSRSYSIGVDATPITNLHLTGNLYYIAINDRLASTPTLGVITFPVLWPRIISEMRLTRPTIPIRLTRIPGAVTWRWITLGAHRDMAYFALESASTSLTTRSAATTRRLLSYRIIIFPTSIPMQWPNCFMHRLRTVKICPLTGRRENGLRRLRNCDMAPLSSLLLQTCLASCGRSRIRRSLRTLRSATKSFPGGMSGSAPTTWATSIQPV